LAFLAPLGVKATETETFTLWPCAKKTRWVFVNGNASVATVAVLIVFDLLARPRLDTLSFPAGNPYRG
jgi:hypothetical protein